MKDEFRLSVRGAARERRGLDGPDAQALEGALQQAERELKKLAAKLKARDEQIAELKVSLGVAETRIRELEAALLGSGGSDENLDDADYSDFLEMARITQYPGIDFSHIPGFDISIDWTGASWVLTEGLHAGDQVTITGSHKSKVFGKVWDADLSCGGTTIFTDDSMARYMDPVTRKPRGE